MHPSHSESRRHSGERVCVAALLAVHTGLLAWSGHCHTPTIDEMGHLPAGIYSWHFGQFNVYNVNPPLVRSLAALPVVLACPETKWNDVGLLERPEWSLGQRFVQANGEKAFQYFTWARWACIPLSLLGGLICYCWASDLYGAPSGCTALALWCFSPNIIANASMITADAGATALGVAAHYTFWRWLRGPTWKRASGAGVVLGLALLSKSTWVFLFLLWPVIAWTWFAGRSARQIVPPSQLVAQCTLIGLLGLYVLNAGYGFEGSFKRLGDFEFRSHLLGGSDATDARAGNRFSGTMLATIPLPVPVNYVRGIDRQKLDFEQKAWSYLNGEHRFGGWWYFYLYAMALKVPLGTWVLLGLATWTTVSRRDGFSAGWRNEMLLLVPALAILVLVSSQTGFSRYLRYALPLFPFLFIWVSKVARAVLCGRWGLATGAVLALAWSCGSSLAVYPHSLSYFNELAGGPRGGHRCLIDASIDWGQDLLFLRRWLNCHPEASPLYAELHAGVSLDSLGIDARDVPVRPSPGWYAISVHCLHDRSGRFQWLLVRTPTAIVGWSIYIYQITPDDIGAGRRSGSIAVAASIRGTGRRDGGHQGEME